MSAFYYRVSPTDILLFKSILTDTQTHLAYLGIRISLTDLYNGFARALGYKSWNSLVHFNQKDILFSDPFDVIQKYLATGVRNTLIAANYDVTNTAQLISISRKVVLQYRPAVNWLDNQIYTQGYANKESTSEVRLNICLRHCGENNYRVIPYTSYMDLLYSMKRELEFQNPLAPIITLTPDHILTRPRLHSGTLPIYQYIDRYAGEYVFVEDIDTLIYGYPVVPQSKIELNEHQQRYLIHHIAFQRQHDYYYELSTDVNEIILHGWKLEGMDYIVGRKSRATAEEREQIKKRAGSGLSGEYTLSLPQFRGVLPVDITRSYRDYCDKAMCKILGLSPI